MNKVNQLFYLVCLIVAVRAAVVAAIPQCLVTASSAQSIPANTSTALIFSNVISDTDTIHSADNITFTIHTSGVYDITAFMPTTANSNWLDVDIRINDSYSAAITQISNASHLNASALVKLNAGDTIKVYGSATTAFTTYYPGTGTACRLSIVKVDNSSIPQCLVIANAAQSIPANTSTLLTFSNVVSDTDTIHGTDGQTFTIHTAGIYSIAAFMPTIANSSWLDIDIRINDAYSGAITQVSNASHVNASAILKLNSGDTVKIYGSATTAFTTYYPGTGTACRLSIAKISD